MALSRSKREYDGVIGFHNYKTADRLLTRAENDNIALKDEEIELQTQLSTLDARRHTLQAENAKDQEQLKSWEAQFSEKTTGRRTHQWYCNTTRRTVAYN